MTINKIISYSGLFFIVVLLFINILKKQKHPNRLWSLLIGLLTFSFNFLIGFLAFGMIYKISATVFAFHPIRWLPGWHMILICLVAADFSYYVAHYLSHKSNILWRTHGLHHSDNEVVFETHFRHSLTSAVVFFAVSVLIAWGLNLGIFYILFYLGVIGLYQLMMHSPNWIWPSFLGAVLILPQNHRYHHTFGGQQKNFGGLFSVWDRMFGTYSNHQFEPIFGLKAGHQPENIKGILWYEDLES